MSSSYERILRECYTGRKVTLEYNNNAFNGVILEETKNTFIIEINRNIEGKKTIKTIPKRGSTLITSFPVGKKGTVRRVRIDGKLLAQRPDKRVKLRIKRKW
ncbi:MAG: ribonuclease P protein subunit [Candidatus Hodarchaeales archaeon]